ncbi:MAG: M23 family metallopeptidase [Clostridiales bacterium]|jgi:murein DD-endopeptidase MepM/ murein hydrolase activator NlpD|nr:M23 family metallopeptidase [Clostridiales bacterium]
MKKLPEDSIFRKKSFFVALYSCVGVVLILAAVVSYYNVQQAKLKNNNGIESQLDETNASKTSPNPQIGVSTPADEDLIAQAQSEAQIRANEQMAMAKATPKPSAAPVASATPAATQTPAIEEEKAEESDEDLAAPVFDTFDDDELMEWPVVGEILMEYSTDHMVYDKTLDQYRTNDNICIAAQAGTPVKASAEGVVLKIEETRRDGNTIVIDNGNGWTTTYGQLMDGVLVKEGDVVKSGQVIGGVSNPTIYGVLLGNHLTLKVTKDDLTVDPLTVLVQLSASEATN